MNYVSKPIFFGLYLAAGLLSLSFSIGPIISGGGTIEPEYTPFFYIGSIFSMCAFVVFVVLIYKMWRIVPLEFARTTPGKAVGFMFIPFFNFYWFFPAIWGWTKDFNSFLHQRQIDSKLAPEVLGLAVVIFWVVGAFISFISGFAGVPLIGLVIGLPNAVLVPLFIYQVCTVLNDLPTEAREATLSSVIQLQEASGPRGFGVASLVLGILSIIIPYLGLILGIVGIVLACKQRKICKEGLSLAGLITSIVGTSGWALLITLMLIFVIISAIS
jgi:hypothetical protein